MNNTVPTGILNRYIVLYAYEDANTYAFYTVTIVAASAEQARVSILNKDCYNKIVVHDVLAAEQDGAL